MTFSVPDTRHPFTVETEVDSCITSNVKEGRGFLTDRKDRGTTKVCIVCVSGLVFTPNT